MYAEIALSISASYGGDKEAERMTLRIYSASVRVTDSPHFALLKISEAFKGFFKSSSSWMYLGDRFFAMKNVETCRQYDNNGRMDFGVVLTLLFSLSFRLTRMFSHKDL